MQRHARRLLSARRLTDLGRFAARLDFHLVTWFGRERDRAAKIDDYVATLKAVHEDFAFPYPTLSLPTLQKFRRSSLTSLHSAMSDDETLSPNLAIDLPDSGYTSLPSGRPPYTSLVSPVASLETQFPTAEAKLTPNLINGELCSAKFYSKQLFFCLCKFLTISANFCVWVSPSLAKSLQIIFLCAQFQMPVVFLAILVQFGGMMRSQLYVGYRRNLWDLRKSILSLPHQSVEQKCSLGINISNILTLEHLIENLCLIYIYFEIFADIYCSYFLKAVV